MRARALAPTYTWRGSWQDGKGTRDAGILVEKLLAAYSALRLWSARVERQHFTNPSIWFPRGAETKLPSTLPLLPAPSSMPGALVL